jgi:hypothetical protein
VAGLVLCAVLAVVVALVWVRSPQRAVLPSQRPGSGAGTAADGPGDRGDAARTLLGRLTRALASGDRADVAALAAPGDPAARRELGDLFANVRLLHLDDLTMRYVDEDAGALPDARRRTLGGRGWVGDVELGWRLRGWDSGPGREEVTMTFVRTARGAAFVTARDDGGAAAPLWLLDRVATRAADRSLVVGARSTRPGRFAALAARAVVDVRRVLPRYRGRLVVEVPADGGQLSRVLGSDPGQYDGIAAVTTTVDGSTRADAPAHIFVNRDVFDPLGPRGSQIVMSHEATHVATGAATSTMPTWLLEGFADFVALDHVDLPVSVTASQVLAAVRRDGPPRHLPGAAEFDPKNQALGASYEAAWLACRLLAQRYGERRLVAFYRAADRAGSTAAPFREVLGTDEAAFTRAWRASLRSLS